MAKVCDKTCLWCKYYYGCSDDALMCNYFLDTGNRRPCDPGKGCTVFEQRKSKRRTTDEYKKERKRNA